MNEFGEAYVPNENSVRIPVEAWREATLPKVASAVAELGPWLEVGSWDVYGVYGVVGVVSPAVWNAMMGRPAASEMSVEVARIAELEAKLLAADVVREQEDYLRTVLFAKIAELVAEKAALKGVIQSRSTPIPTPDEPRTMPARALRGGDGVQR